MTDRELRRLNRKELLEILILQRKEISRLEEELGQAKIHLEDRRIRVSRAGSLAEAAVELNGVFQAAQAAADQYLENIQHSESQARELLQETRKRCRELEEETRKRCESLKAEAQGRRPVQKGEGL